MAKSRKTEVTAGIDIGDEAVRVVIAEPTGCGVDVLGVGKAASTGIKRGMVVNIESTVTAIRAAVEAAVLMAGREVAEAYVNITGPHVYSFNSHGMVAIDKKSEVRPDDVGRVLKTAKAVRLSPGREFIHVLPIEFSVDENTGVKKPIGMAGARLESEVHMVTAARSAMDNVLTCCNREGIRVNNLIYSALAASEVMLHEDEKELGVVLADIGAGTTDLIVWYNGSVIYTGVVALGGAAITNDIAVGLRTPRAEAELIKIRHGCALSSLVGEEEVVDVPGTGGRPAQQKSRKFLAEIIEPKVEEIFTNIGTEIRRAGLEEHVSSGLVLVGGTSRMPGIAELGSQILGIPVRAGEMVETDPPIGGVANVVADPSYAVALGCVLIGQKMEPSNLNSGFTPHSGGVWQKIARWFKDNFVMG